MVATAKAPCFLVRNEVIETRDTIAGDGKGSRREGGQSKGKNDLSHIRFLGGVSEIG
ncbi:hypothetical protein OP10G_3775 [Fimbriimonas ginsengisoli Gsoil 348]|uniref:Uncharacterized protein n=1 Tax=Fimbriimonas ginsengisoli Gsoil 348 TaxID=661478 RepID=A0A068NUE6_FIMGI|nr:hypothetical protein OP10G_3775 [Fimbriimonas ginsengisoli Gsoil 348]